MVRLGARNYFFGRILLATVTSVSALLAFALQFSPGRHAHPEPWGFYIGLAVLGWGAAATYEAVTGIVSALSSACFCAFFVGTYSAAIVFGPINLATGELCQGDEANGAAVAWQMGTSATLVIVVIISFLFVVRQPGPRAEFVQMDKEVGRIVGETPKGSTPKPLTALQRHQLETWMQLRNVQADPWIKVALEFGVTPEEWADLKGRVGRGESGPTGTTLNPVAANATSFSEIESSTDDAPSPPATTTSPAATPAAVTTTSPATASSDAAASSHKRPSFFQTLKACWKPASGLFINTFINIVVTGMYVRLGVIAVSLFYEFYLGTAVGATFTLSKKLKGLGINAVLLGVALRFLYLPFILPAVYHPGSVSDGPIHALNVPWTVLGGWCYTMTWIKASAVDGGTRVMSITYFVGMSIGILVVIILNEHEKTQE